MASSREGTPASGRTRGPESSEPVTGTKKSRRKIKLRDAARASAFIRKKPCVEQWVQTGIAASSSSGARIYQPGCVCGPPTVFPRYADKPDTWSPRTFGSPGCRHFLDVEFSQHVYPQSIMIYETYVPGTVVAVYAKKNEVLEGKKMAKFSWYLLWRGEATATPSDRGKQHCKANIFSPLLKHVKFSTKRILIEFDTSTAVYAPQIDAIKLVGSKKYQFKSQPKQEESRPFFVALLAAQKAKAAFLAARPYLLKRKKVEERKPCLFDPVPDDFLRKAILGRLDWFTRLGIVASSCWRLNHLARSLEGITDLRLGPQLFPQLTDSVLHQLLVEGQADPIVLDLRWCMFLNQCSSAIGGALRGVKVLNLDGCTSLGSDFVKMVAASAPVLEELHLGRRSGEEFEIESEISDLRRGCNRLRILSLNDTKLGDQGLRIIASWPELRSLDISHCLNVSDSGSLFLINQATSLQRLILNGCSRLTKRNFDALSIRPSKHLVTLDVSWLGLSEFGPGVSWPATMRLVSSCCDIEHLSLNGIRWVNDEALVQLAEIGRRLRSLQLVGTRCTLGGLQILLDSCLLLKYLDICFVRGIQPSDALLLEFDWPGLCVKYKMSVKENPAVSKHKLRRSQSPKARSQI